MRVFAAVFPPKEALEGILEVQRELRAGVRAKAFWPAPEKLHITLRFFGDAHTPEEAVAAAERAVEDATAFEISMETIGGFPNARRARVGFMSPSPSQGGGTLARVAAALADPKDRKPHPHLTLARFREPTHLPNITFEPINFPVTEVLVVNSILGGPEKGYHILSRLEL